MKWMDSYLCKACAVLVVACTHLYCNDNGMVIVKLNFHWLCSFVSVVCGLWVPCCHAVVQTYWLPLVAARLMRSPFPLRDGSSSSSFLLLACLFKALRLYGAHGRIYWHLNLFGISDIDGKSQLVFSLYHWEASHFTPIVSTGSDGIWTVFSGWYSPVPQFWVPP